MGCASLSDTVKYLLTSLDPGLGSWAVIIAGGGAHGSADRAVQPHALRTLLCYELLVHTASFGDNSLIAHLARFPWLDDLLM